MKYRIEHDLLGEKELPEELYWGIHTFRAVENFRISGRTADLLLIKKLALVKKACCSDKCRTRVLKSGDYKRD